MIFVTVGAQIPFDRLVRTVDAWCGRSSRRDVFAQVGPSGYRPAHMEWAEFLSPDDFRRHVQEAEILVSHAGMGSILTALQYRKPIVVLPRRAELRETRSNHQISTVLHFARKGMVVGAEGAVCWRL